MRINSKRILLVLLCFAIIAGALGFAPARAQSADPAPNKAGLVVVQSDGRVESRCVGFPEASISGYDLLVRGGFAPRSEVTAMGVSVCSLDGQGCDAGQDCFCQCKSSTCRYWTYWQHLPAGWRYSNAGAATVQVHDGDLQAWVWGESKPNASAENAPPTVAFADLCSAEAKLYGIAAAAATLPATSTAMTQPWLVAFVIGAPLLLAALWWLWQRRRTVQP